MDRHAHNALDENNIVVDSPYNFPHCYAYGCAKRMNIIFNNKDWVPIQNLFSPAARSPEAEREKISQAIAIFEQKAGAQAGTSADKSGTFGEMFSNADQHDCVDESLNTSVYLQLLERKGLLKFHEAAKPAVRLPLFHSGGWPHQSATIKEINSGTIYAVDSWFHDNGYPAEIITLEDWRDGWKPDSIQRHNTDPTNFE